MQGICLTPLTVWCSVAMMPLREMRMSSRCSVSWSRSRRRSRVWKNQDPSSVVLQALCPVITHSGLSFVTLFGCLRRFQDCFQGFSSNCDSVSYFKYVPPKGPLARRPARGFCPAYDTSYNRHPVGKGHYTCLQDGCHCQPSSCIVLYRR